MELNVAIIGPAHGLRGEVILDVRTDLPEKRLSPGAEVETDSGTTLTVDTLKQIKNRFVAGFVDVTSREEAEALRGTRLIIQVDTGAELEDDEDADGFYPYQLKGLAAETVQGEKLGTVTGLQFGAAQDLLQVKTDSGQVLVPFVKQIVPVVDLEAGIVQIDPPGGLFSDQDLSD